MASANPTVASINPLRKASWSLFEHGRAHLADEESSDRPFERLVAGVHFDNALELYLKYFGMKYRIPGCDRKQVPLLLTELQANLPELSVFAGDLLTFHLMRNGAYHFGNSLDETTLTWGFETIRSFFASVQHRERMPTTLPDGGIPKNAKSKKMRKAEKEFNRAIQLFSRTSPTADKRQLIDILTHTLRAIEFWIDETLLQSPDNLGLQYRAYSMNKKLDMLRMQGLVKDFILLGELADLNRLRNKVAHASKEGGISITFNDVYHYLQIAAHFIKVKSPSSYSIERLSPLPKLKTMTQTCVRSKSALIIANILTSLGLNYYYEKPLYAKDGSQKIPDFTIRYGGKEFYWEHTSDLVSSRYNNAWQDKLKWYKDHGYYDNLIVTTESSKGFDSFEIARIAKERILESEKI